MSVSAAICGFRVSARGHGDTKAPASVVTICLLLSTFGASHGGGKACRLLGSESTVSLTTFCEAEDVHKKGRVLCGRCSLARSPPLWPQGRATPSPPRETRADDRAQNVASFRFEFVTRQYVCPNRHSPAVNSAKSAHVQMIWGERRGHGTIGDAQRLPMELPRCRSE